MNKFRLVLILAFCFSLLSCEEDELLKVENNRNSTESINLEDFTQGYVRIQISEALCSKFEGKTQKNGTISFTELDEICEVAKAIGAEKMVRTFPPAGKFEQRTRKCGLHLWYDVYFNAKTPLRSAGETLKGVEGVTLIDYIPKMKIVGNPKVISYSDRTSNNLADVALPFNDPKLEDQWHYYNDGSMSGAVAGSDINVFPAWSNYTVGSSQVVVSVVDGGIDYDHEDIEGNMWINLAELNGTPGVDDDGNGYVDDIYGYNFVSNNPTIVAHDHGTHVAGTIAAVNNNGKGVCGIAGGDYTKGVAGARLMSCQIFVGSSGNGSGAAAIKYGADNGAIISQNSWGYESITYMPSSDKAAIDYFNTYAGLDESGVQVGPMHGGIVIFAAGNDNKDISFPASYEGVFSVASIGHDFRRAYYSNYGSWVDITATGGDANKDAMVLSTLPDNKYGKMQGTSMACPHVSGVAALLISRFGGMGFTTEMLKSKMVSTANDVINNFNGSYQLGAGLIDAFAAIASYSTQAPDKVETFTGSVQANTISLDWVVPADADDTKPYSFTIYYSKNSLAGFDGSDMSGVSSLTVNTGQSVVGDIISTKVSGLEFSKNYNFIIRANDYAGNASQNSEILSISTLPNNNPVITALNGVSISMKPHETKTLKFCYYDPDGHEVVWAIDETSGVTATVESQDTLAITFVGKEIEAGTYTTTLVVTDSYGASSNVVISYTIEPNTPPVILSNIENVLFGAVGGKKTINLADYIYDADGEQLKYSFKFSKPAVVHLVANADVLSINTLSFGATDVVLTATDVLGETVSITFQVLVRDQSRLVDLYPNPVTDVLNVRTGDEQTVSLKIFGTSGANVYDGILTTSPFTPAQVNMSNIDAGVYNVRVEIGGQEYTSTIVKL